MGAPAILTIGQFRARAGSAAARELRLCARYDTQQRDVMPRDPRAGARIARLSAESLARAERADGYAGPVAPGEGGAMIDIMDGGH